RLMRGLAAAGLLPAGWGPAWSASALLGLTGCGSDGSSGGRGSAGSGAAGSDEDALVAELWLSAQGDEQESYGVAMLEAGGSDVEIVRSGFRGHDLAQHPTEPEVVVMFGRRPGRFGFVLDIAQGVERARFDVASNRSLMGHGFFSLDGRLLYTTEADTVSGEGYLAVRRTDTWAQVAEISTGGIGPHQACLMPGGDTAVIANGGILTRPETGREKLNLDTMDSSICILELESGRELDRQRVAEPKASIRHLDVDDEGAIAIGLQVQREAMEHTELVPLVGAYRQGESIVLFEAGAEVMGSMNDYVGSVALNPATRVAGFTSPRGNLAAFWSVDDGSLLGFEELADVSGITVSADRSTFVISSSVGQVRHIDATTLEERREMRHESPGVRWDNHLITARRSREEV
ncbi:MAG: DUF1513 domain-containing protein, partial [Myxococcota bacterium]